MKRLVKPIRELVIPAGLLCTTFVWVYSTMSVL